MTESVFPLTALSEAQRAQAFERFTIIRPALEEGVSQAQVARTAKQAPSTIRLWIKRYREKGLVGLANHVSRSDKGTSRRLPDTAIRLIELIFSQVSIPRGRGKIERFFRSVDQLLLQATPGYAPKARLLTLLGISHQQFSIETDI
jgi:transposase InsO family protein